MLALPILLGACTPAFHAGSPPPIDRLSGLTLGASTSTDLSASLGTPPGLGAAGLPDGTRQDMWVYESHDAEGSVSHQAILFVFVDPQSGVFNGYLWFRSGRIIVSVVAPARRCLVDRPEGARIRVLGGGGV